jgi:hypothetical protein
MLHDSLKNPIVPGLYVSVELDQPIRGIKGRIDSVEKGTVSTLHAPGKDPKATPTRVVIMVPVEIFLDPRAEIASNISALKIPLPVPSVDNPRRSHVELMTPAELAIHEAMDKVAAVPEPVGVDKVAAAGLNVAISLLSQAKDKVSDFVDGISAKTEG